MGYLKIHQQCLVLTTLETSHSTTKSISSCSFIYSAGVFHSASKQQRMRWCRKNPCGKINDLMCICSGALHAVSLKQLLSISILGEQQDKTVSYKRRISFSCAIMWMGLERYRNRWKKMWLCCTPRHVI